MLAIIFLHPINQKSQLAKNYQSGEVLSSILKGRCNYCGHVFQIKQPDFFILFKSERDFQSTLLSADEKNAFNRYPK